MLSTPLRHSRALSPLLTSLPPLQKKRTVDQHPTRLYHATTRKEIIPLIALGVVGGIGYYSYRAVK